MKQILILAAVFCFGIFSYAQNAEGKIVYERTQQMQILINGDDNPPFANMIPKERKDRFELLFSGNKTLWQSLPENESDDMNFSSGGAQIHMIMPGSNDILYHNLTDQKKVEQREFFGKNFLVLDSIKRMDWKLGEETKDILGHACKKAISVRTQESTRVNNENGVITRKKFIDTLNIVAWFAMDIPVFTGPETYQGQLPGAVLEININDGKTTFKAVEISDKVNAKDIKEPKSGKKVTGKEFAAEREKIMKEMQENGGVNINIRHSGN